MSGIFPISADELACLAARDGRLGRAIELIGPIARQTHSGAFRGLAHAICGQQISAKAHKSVWTRFCAAFPPEDPAAAASAALEDIKKCGLSLRKAGYIQNIAALFARKELSDEELKSLDEDALRERLTLLPGVGKWTADMLLIFTFQRKNILCYEDLAIRKGLRALYGGQEITPSFFERCRRLYSPLGSAASMYLWEIAGGAFPHWKDPAAEAKKRK